MPAEKIAPASASSDVVTFRPFGKWILINPDKAPEKIGSIILPDSVRAAQAPDTGVVVKMGPGLLRFDGGRTPMPDVKIGQRVLIVAGTLEHAVKLRAEGGKMLALVGADGIIAAYEDDATSVAGGSEPSAPDLEVTKVEDADEGEEPTLPRLPVDPSITADIADNGGKFILPPPFDGAGAIDATVATPLDRGVLFDDMVRASLTQ